ncbi:MAG: HNH endonuclease [Candidatus Omnitrophica bacterium]|nr:HNH endonuclease [Candidatus Omnitrophota bacterium]
MAYNSVDKKEGAEQKVTDDKRIQQTPKRQREEISIRKRFLVFKRDQFTCVLCGRSGIGVKLEVDHKNPLSKGGSNNTDNLQTLCFECNRGKRNDRE